MISNSNTTRPQAKKSSPKDGSSQAVSTKQQEIVLLCKELLADGIERDIVNSTLEENCGSINPNKIKDIKLLEKTFKALDEIRQNKKEGK